jgi:hypothetical protein
MYTSIDFPTLKALKDAVKTGRRISVYQPGLGVNPKPLDTVCVEGPHYPKPHKWYVRVRLGADVCIDKVLR